MKAFLAGALALLVLIAAPAAAEAVTINVNTTQDEYGEGPTSCSLREAITAAQTNASLGGCSAGSGPDTILLPGGTYKITRAGAGEDANSTGDLDITGPDNLLIRPAGPTDRVIVDGNAIDRVFDKSGMGETTFESIRVMGGKITDIEDGGGIRVAAGNLFVENVTVDGNESAYQGGGIAAYSTVHLTNSTVSGNKAGGNGGGIYAPGGSVVQVRSTTIYGNTADSDGDGNGFGGGFSEAVSLSVGFTNVLNAGNSAALAIAPARANDCYSGLTYFPRFTLQTQAVGEPDCLATPGPQNVTVTDAMVGPLAYNGGQTPTHNLLKGSPAIGAGGTVAPDACPPIDQNGVGRIAGSCDIGSTTYVPKSELGIAQVLPKKKVIRRKKARPITVVLVNSGDATAEEVRVCLVLPKAARKGLKVKGNACRTPGDIAAGATKKPKVRLAAKPRAKKRMYLVRIKVTTRGAQLPVQVFKVRVR